MLVYGRWRTFVNARFLKHVFKAMVDLLESRSVIGTPMPTLLHEIVNPRRTPWRALHPSKQKPRNENIYIRLNENVG